MTMRLVQDNCRHEDSGMTGGEMTSGRWRRPLGGSGKTSGAKCEVREPHKAIRWQPAGEHRRWQLPSARIGLLWHQSQWCSTLLQLFLLVQLRGRPFLIQRVAAVARPL